MKYRHYKKVNVSNIICETEDRQKNWLQHIHKMKTNRISKQAMEYKQ